jgi:dTDP-4-dehydrorhamnose reductase
MNIIIIGADGQLGRALEEIKPETISLKAFSKLEFDITNFQKSRELVKEIQPELIINAAAYTAVDKAEDEAEKAYSVNAYGVENISKISRDQGIKLVHISTDYVFDGKSNRPYNEGDSTNPINTYGDSKLKGEQLALDILDKKLLIIRTAWLYSHEGPSFLNSIIHLLKEKNSVNIVEDQIGTPTSAINLAKAIYKSIETDLQGVFHYTDAGVASWYDFACAIKDNLDNQYIGNETANIYPIVSKNYKTIADRPMYTVLDKTAIRNAADIEVIHWKKALEEEIQRVTK